MLIKAVDDKTKTKSLDTGFLIKADQFPDWHTKWVDKDDGILDAISLLADVRGTATIQEWAEKIVRQHRPAPVLDLPAFMAPKAEPVRPPVAAPVAATQPVGAAHDPDESIKRKLVCATCRAKISFPEGKFCWNQEQRFGGYQYCREHQAAFR